jgi:hypothetical protein
MISVAALLLIALFIGGVAIWRKFYPSESRLLAMAYNQQRTTVLRITGGDPVAMRSGTRSSTENFSDPATLLELKLRAQKHLERTPRSAYWHQILGQVYILENNGYSA